MNASVHSTLPPELRQTLELLFFDRTGFRKYLDFTESACVNFPGLLSLA